MAKSDLELLAEEYYLYVRRLVRVVVGFTLLLAGVVLIFIPGPAIIVIPVALAVLAGEFVWARKLLHRVKDEIVRFTEGGDGSGQK